MTFYSLFFLGGGMARKFLKSFRASVIKLQNSKHYVTLIATEWPEHGCQPIIVLRVGAIVLNPQKEHIQILMKKCYSGGN